MLRETAIVKSVEGQQAIIVTESKLACAGCKVASGCGNGIIEGYMAPKLFETPVNNKIGAKAGDKVLVEIEESLLTRASLLVYTLPLLVMFVAATLSTLITEKDSMIAVGGLLGLGLGVVLVRFIARNMLDLSRFEPRILPLISQPGGNK